jgi:uncharacterized membrane protein YphA (DoxX/SURF4 family)
MYDKYLFLAIIFLTLLFLLSGINKAKNITGTAKYLQSKVKVNVDFSLYKIAIISAIILQILCPLIILYHIHSKKYKKYAKLSIDLLILFTIIATLLFHYPPVGKDYYSFMSNLSTIGGLMVVRYYITI